MIMPADEPGVAIVSKRGEPIRLVGSSRFKVHGSRAKTHRDFEAGTLNLEHTGWTVGRAGMMYRDLIPDRLGGKIIASHIRIMDGGEVPDSVHYHKIVFQVIYCLKGAIRVVYEDQGPPFWLKPGDCVLQPPEIRHRVLEAEAGSEVIEITSPAEHETWFDHEIRLPTESLRPSRVFGTQRFVRHLESKAAWQAFDDGDILVAGTEIAAAGDGTPDVYTLKAKSDRENLVECSETPAISLQIVVDGRGISVTQTE